MHNYKYKSNCGSDPRKIMLNLGSSLSTRGSHIEAVGGLGFGVALTACYRFDLIPTINSNNIHLKKGSSTLPSPCHPLYSCHPPPLDFYQLHR